jgi:hypothetical protein
MVDVKALGRNPLGAGLGYAPGVAGVRPETDAGTGWR